MDHIGRKLSTSLALDSKDDTRFCHLCPYARASAYCVDCWIYLCPRCKGQHKKYPAFKNHQLLKGEEMSSLYATEHGTRTDDMDKCSDFISSTGLASSTAVRPPDQKTSILRQMADLRLDEEAYIADMAAVTPGTILISNGMKKCVQLLDNRKGRLLCEVQLQDEPGRMCLTDRNTAAVCVGEDEIQMIQVKDKTLIPGRALTVGKYVLGITSSRNTLVVSYRKKPWLEKVSMDGKVLKQFDMRQNSEHFKFPHYICTTPDGSVFISDQGTQMITQVDGSLNLLQTFTSSLLKWPDGITAVREDQILVCSYYNHSIVLLQPSTNTVSTLLGKEDEILNPYSLTYCPDEKKLFVASPSTEIINVYQIA